MDQKQSDKDAVSSHTSGGREFTIHGLTGPVADEDLVESVAQPKVPPTEGDENHLNAIRAAGGAI